VIEPAIRRPPFRTSEVSLSPGAERILLVVQLGDAAPVVGARTGILCGRAKHEIISEARGGTFSVKSASQVIPCTSTGGASNEVNAAPATAALQAEVTIHSSLPPLQVSFSC
jgi:hypothetical protein